MTQPCAEPATENRLSSERDILALVAGDAWRMAALGAVAGLGLPDAWIGAGFLRGAVWDRLHGYQTRTTLADIDVIYFDSEVLDPAVEAALERRLGAVSPGLPWSVRNQARMHLKNGDPPYRSSADALAHWLETPTAVALRLNQGGGLELLTPLGTEDLFSLVVRPTPHARAHRLDAYRKRMAKKNWPAKWPRLRMIWD
jgi:hypothetical protein